MLIHQPQIGKPDPAPLVDPCRMGMGMGMGPGRESTPTSSWADCQVPTFLRTWSSSCPFWFMRSFLDSWVCPFLPVCEGINCAHLWLIPGLGITQWYCRLVRSSELSEPCHSRLGCIRTNSRSRPGWPAVPPDRRVLDHAGQGVHPPAHLVPKMAAAIFLKPGLMRE